MATSSNEIERIVRKVLNEEQDETIDAIRELSALLTEQVIPRLSKGDEDESEADEDVDADQGDVVSMSAFSDEDAPSSGRRAKPNGRSGHDDEEEANPPDQDVPTAVMDAFATLYSTLSSEQASALAELFTVIDSELDGEGHADEAQDEDEEKVLARA